MERDHVAAEARLLEAALQPGATVLDAGCGRTTRLADYRDRIDRLVGLDIDEAAGQANPSVDDFVHADLSRTLPFADATFDFVYANFVVEHLDEPRRTFAEWHRILKPTGSLVLLTSNRANPFVVVAGWIPARVRLSIKRCGAAPKSPTSTRRGTWRTRPRGSTPDGRSGL